MAIMIPLNSRFGGGCGRSVSASPHGACNGTALHAFGMTSSHQSTHVAGGGFVAASVSAQGFISTVARTDPAARMTYSQAMLFDNRWVVCLAGASCLSQSGPRRGRARAPISDVTNRVRDSTLACGASVLGSSESSMPVLSLNCHGMRLRERINAVSFTTCSGRALMTSVLAHGLGSNGLLACN